MSYFTIFYSLLAVILGVVWLLVEIKLVYRAKTSYIWRTILTIAALLLGGLTYKVTGSLSDQLTGYASMVIILVIAFWPKGLTQNSVIANLNTVRQLTTISKVVLTTTVDEVELRCFAGELQIAKLKFKQDPATLQKFLAQKLPKKRLVINQG